MDNLIPCFVLLALAVLLLPFALVIAHARKIKNLETTLRKLSDRMDALEVAPLAEALAPVSSAAPAQPEPTPAPITPIPPPLPTSVLPSAPVPPPPVVEPTSSAPAPPPVPVPPKTPRPAIDWEAFMGVKLFAWVGGFVLFLGVVFLVKYSFDNNLVTPTMQVIIGALVGCGLIAAGWLTTHRNYRVPGQSLCATGVLILYADIFGAHTFLSLISLPVAFALMSLITVAAFFLAVSMNAQVVVVLGLVGGFLTPLLLTTGNHPWPTFSYIALLNAGIAAVALRKRWDYLFLLAALGTVAIESLWVPIHDAQQMRFGFPICLGLQAEFLLFAWLRQRIEPNEKWSTPAAALVGFASIGYVFILLSKPSLATQPGFFLGFAFLADIGLLFLATMRPNPARIAGPAATAVFLLLAVWTGKYLEHDLLWWGLGAYIVFALIHSGFTVWPKRPETAKPASTVWQGFIPLLALVLLFICVWNGETSFAVWACVLVINLVAVALAWSAASVLALIVALVATLITVGLWVITAPPIHESIGAILTVVGGFGIFFTTAATLLVRNLAFGPNDNRRNVPALAAAMPFVLLLMVVWKLPMPEPTAVFSVALILGAVLLGLGILARSSWVAVVALAFTWALEMEWHLKHFSAAHPSLPLGWYVVFCLLFVAYPFFAAKEKTALPWAIGAFSGALHFALIHDLITATYPGWRDGFLPALFILPYAVGVFYLIRKLGVIAASGDARLTWQGGAALLFLSLIFPLQFEREWITLGWAFEGLALLAFFRVVPNAGLRLVGAGLLCMAFVRLALNPAVLEYHPRTGTRIWNWYLYAYGLTSVCLFVGAWLVQKYRETLLARVIPRLLYALGTLLTFLLLNIEIADFFSIGPTLTFSFSGNFARDMTYSIAWALFAFALLLVGMKRHTRFVRYAGLALLIITVAKLFLHDLINLSPLYRIGAFMAVAVILIVASFVYQRFLRPTPAKANAP